MMDSGHIILAVLFAQCIAVMSPGPDFAIVMRNALNDSRRAGILTALGIAIGVSFHTLYCIYFLSFMLSTQWLIVPLIKYLGAAYLVYLSVRSFISAVQLWQARFCDVTPPDKNKADAAKNFFLDGFFCNLLNPKAVLFFLSIFTVVIAQGVSHTDKEIVAIGMILITFGWFSLVSWSVTHVRVRHIFSSHTFQAWVNFTVAVIFLLFALLLLLVTI